jgi:hypothetical protein
MCKWSRANEHKDHFRCITTSTVSFLRPAILPYCSVPYSERSDFSYFTLVDGPHWPDFLIMVVDLRSMCGAEHGGCILSENVRGGKVLLDMYTGISYGTCRWHDQREERCS